MLAFPPVGKRIDLDKLRSINQGGDRGNARITRLRGDRGTTGFQIEHGDGRVEGVVRPATTRTRMSVSTGEVVTDGS